MKGIVLAGGTGSRLWPLTKTVSKQLLPIYDKPMVYYPISTLMLAGIREILVITTPTDRDNFEALLGDGSAWGIRLCYGIQERPAGLAQALIIAEGFLKGDSSMMILGDNLFYGTGLGRELSSTKLETGCHIFITKVSNPSDYGVLTFNVAGEPSTIIEKPSEPSSPWAVTGMYMFDSQASQIAKEVKPSHRGELEITSVLEYYLNNQQLSFTKLSRGKTWLDTGNPQALLAASIFVQVIEERTGLKIACPEEIAWNNGWITDRELESSIQKVGKDYGKYLAVVLAGDNHF
jgi:glucose-1-phosphate thymidylyltransferase